MRLAGDEISLTTGDLTISPAGMSSSYDLEGAGRHWCIHFDPVDKGQEIVTLPLHLPLGRAAGAAQEQMAHIARLLASDSERDRARAAFAMQELLLWIDDLVNGPRARETMADRAAHLIDDRFHEPLTVDAIVRALGASQAHLARSFRARFGVTMQSRLFARRMSHARYLLESTDLPIWRIAERVGISDAQHFNKSVRRYFGESPSSLRARAEGVPQVDPDR
jgi:AraC-like DNA-binding protein